MDMDLESIKPRYLAPIILNVLNEGRYVGKTCLTLEELYRIIIGHRPSLKSDWLLFKYRVSSARGYLRRKKFNDVWIEPRLITKINNKGNRITEYAYSIAETSADYNKSVEVIDTMIDKLDKGKQTRLKKMRELKEQRSLRQILTDLVKEEIIENA